MRRFIASLLVCGLFLSSCTQEAPIDVQEELLTVNDQECNAKYFEQGVGRRVKAIRVIWNSPSTFGGIGNVYNAFLPSLTLGCGSYGANSVGDNVSAVNLLLKLRNLELGYNFDSRKLQKAGIENFRVYLSAHNLATFSGLLKNYNLDPERISGYPTIKSYNVGVSITF